MSSGMSFWQLFISNLRIVIRNRRGFFWTVVMPAGMYVILSLLPVGVILGKENYSSYLLPGVIALTIMQGGIYTLAYWTVDLKGRGVIRRFQVTPLSKKELVLSLLFARSAIIVAQVFL